MKINLRMEQTLESQTKTVCIWNFFFLGELVWWISCTKTIVKGPLVSCVTGQCLCIDISFVFEEEDDVEFECRVKETTNKL